MTPDPDHGVRVRGEFVCWPCMTPSETLMTVIFVNESGHSCERCGKTIKPIR